MIEVLPLLYSQGPFLQLPFSPLLSRLLLPLLLFLQQPSAVLQLPSFQLQRQPSYVLLLPSFSVQQFSLSQQLVCAQAPFAQLLS